MSRPSWSVPSQCAAEGGSRRCPTDCVSGSYGARRGASSAHSANTAISAIATTLSGDARIGTRLAPGARRPAADATATSATLQPRVEPVVGDVDDEVRQRIDDRSEQRYAEHRREVEAHGGCGGVTAEYRPAEDRLREDRAGEETPEREPQGR